MKIVRIALVTLIFAGQPALAQSPSKAQGTKVDVTEDRAQTGDTVLERGVSQTKRGVARPGAPCPSGGHFRIPEFSTLQIATQKCFSPVYGFSPSGFPPTGCGRLCVDPRACVVPTPSAQRPYTLVQPTGPVDDMNPDATEPVPEHQLGRGYYKTLLPLVDTAWAFLLDNLDVVDWLSCEITEYSADLPLDEQLSLQEGLQYFEDHKVPYPGESMGRCLERLLTEGEAVLAIDPEPWFDASGKPEGATGIAFNKWRPDLAGPQGVQIPGAHSAWLKWAELLNTHLDSEGLSRTGQTRFTVPPENAMCAVMSAAAVIVHELLHSCGGKNYPLVGEPELPQWTTGEGVAPYCNIETVMLHGSLMILMGQRYPCIQTAACCSNLDSADWMAGIDVAGYNRRTCP